MAIHFKNPIFLALDLPNLADAKAMASQVKGHVGGLKLGMEFFYAHGPDGYRTIADIGLPIFLDLKLYDIPNTVAGGFKSLRALSPAIVTVHASGGRAMMEAAKAAVGPDTKVVAVTMLTSMDRQDLVNNGISDDPRTQVLRLAQLAKSSGLDGIVCSGQEVADVHAQWQDGFFVTPGIRPAGADVGDQKRVVTPRMAMDDGSSVLVIGRPISKADDPAAAARAIAETL